ncbi:hypothetical protein MKK63_21550, partial [Methylobacterium sp. J-088]|uniref:glycoside hydrolase family protein n=1 Tax=Methylobacterium sp. J-088 TaxID=2836664 RepID=UPI001FB95E78
MAEPLVISFAADTSRAQGAMATLAAQIVGNMTSIGVAMSGGAANSNGFDASLQGLATNAQRAAAAVGQDVRSIASATANAATADKAPLDRVEALQAGVSSAALRAAGAELAYTGRTDRPGQGGLAFALVADAAQLGGDTGALPRLAADALAFGADGSVARVRGSSVIGSRVAYPVEPGRVYRARFVVRRRADASDPSNDTVRLAIAWLDQAKNVLPGARAFTVVKDLRDLLASAGRQEVATTFAASPGAAVLIAAPPNAVYARPFVQTFGADGLTDIAVIVVRDLTDALSLDPVSTDALARLSAIESQNLGPRVAAVESRVQNPDSLTFTTRADAAAATIPGHVTSVVTRGAIAPGDGGRVHARVADLEPYVAAVRAALAKPVPQPFFDACCSLCFNIGQPNFAHSSVVRLANAGDLARAVEAFLMWDRPGSILIRRQGERDQAALAAYGAVYARRGDREPVRAPIGATPIAPARPDPLAPITGRPAVPAESWWLWLRDAVRHNMRRVPDHGVRRSPSGLARGRRPDPGQGAARRGP